MDLRLVLFDPTLMRRICADAGKDLQTPVEQLPLFGSEPLDVQACPKAAVLALKALSSDEQTPLWELQWCTLVLLYMSETLERGFEEGTPPAVFNHWFRGGSSVRSAMLPFRERFELNLGGMYTEKKKRGARKTVQLAAKTALETTVHEVLLLHLVGGMRVA